MTATSAPPPRADDPDLTRNSLAHRETRTVPRAIGALFLAGFVTYGLGFALAGSVTGGSDVLVEVSAHGTLLALGVFLLLLNTAVDLGKAVLFFPILDRHSRRTALAYLATMTFEVALLAVGALSLLALVPVAAQVEDGQLGAETGRALASLAVESNAMAYQVAQAGLAFGAVFLCLLLYRTEMVPRLLAGLGVVGYVAHFTGAAAEVFGAHVSTYLLIPGALFELGLAFWLILRGIDATAHAGRAAPGATAGPPARR